MDPAARRSRGPSIVEDVLPEVCYRVPSKHIEGYISILIALRLYSGDAERMDKRQLISEDVGAQAVGRGMLNRRVPGIQSIFNKFNS